MTSLKRLGIAVLSILLTSGLVLADDGPGWVDLTGTWRGKGLLRDSPSGELERGVCKFQITTVANGAEMTIKGRCANAAQSASISTILKGNQSSDRITAVTRSKALPSPVALSGTYSGSRIALSSDASIEIEGRDYSVASRINITKARNALMIEQALTDTETGSRSVRFQMNFERMN